MVTLLSGISDSLNDEMTLSENSRKQWIVSQEDYFNQENRFLYCLYNRTNRLILTMVEDRAEISWNIHP